MECDMMAPSGGHFLQLQEAQCPVALTPEKGFLEEMLTHIPPPPTG